MLQQQAGIYPTSEQVEYFSHLLPGASFLDILTLFFKMMQLDSTFFLCDVEEQLEAARHLQDLKIPLRDMYKMSLAPVSNSMAVLREVRSVCFMIIPAPQKVVRVVVG